MQDCEKEYIYKVIESLEINGPDFELAIIELLTNPKIPHYVDTLREVLKQLSNGNDIIDIEDSELWFKLQEQYIRFLILAIDERL